MQLIDDRSHQSINAFKFLTDTRPIIGGSPLLPDMHLSESPWTHDMQLVLEEPSLRCMQGRGGLPS